MYNSLNFQLLLCAVLAPSVGAARQPPPFWKSFFFHVHQFFIANFSLDFYYISSIFRVEMEVNTPKLHIDTQ